MPVEDQLITDKYALYLGDSCEVITTIPDESIHFSIYSPPFAASDGGLYHYSSSERDLSNSRNYDEFFEHYGFLVGELSRVTLPGRMTAVHCMDIPSGNSGKDHMTDFPGDIIRLHAKHGFKYVARYCVWKDPYVVYLRTMAKNLQHKTIVEDSSRCSAASSDYLLVFRKNGENSVPIAHPHGILNYAGSRAVPKEFLKFKNWQGKQTENKYSQWIWRQYASAFWDDVRLDRVLPFREAKDPEDEKHVHPLQLDVIERAVILWSNPDEAVFTPFMGVGSEVYMSVVLRRKAVGIELKPSYFKQAVLNMKAALDIQRQDEGGQLNIMDMLNDKKQSDFNMDAETF